MKRRLLSRQRAVNKWTRQGSSIPFSSLQSENEGHSIISLLSGNNMPDRTFFIQNHNWETQKFEVEGLNCTVCYNSESRQESLKCRRRWHLGKLYKDKVSSTLST